jgi:SecD/SecF fusion protein
MQNLITKIILIALILIGCAFAVMPPEKKIRLGRDLSGGVSLIYSVRMDDDTLDRQAVLSQTIEVLKERVNPDGVLDIQMTPLGTDRIEVVMPLPNAEVKELADTYRAKLGVLLEKSQIRPGELDQSLADGDAVIIFGSEAGRGQLVQELQTAWTELKEAIDYLKQDPNDGLFEQRVADLEIDVEDLREQLLAMSLDKNEVMRLIQLSRAGEPLRDEKGYVIRDEGTGEILRGTAPRDTALVELEMAYPQLSSQLTELVGSFDDYQNKRTGFDDPEDLIRMLRGAGVLEFRIAVSSGKAEGVDVDDLRTQLAKVGPDNTDSTVASWFPLNEVNPWADTPAARAALRDDVRTYFASTRALEAAEYDGEYYLLLYDNEARALTHRGGKKWSVTAAYSSADQFGRLAVAFRLDAPGGHAMGRLTGAYINEPMAIVLDGQVYTVANISSQINGQGQITGSFSQSEIDYLLRVLAAGSLEARLSPDPIAVNIIGPTLGQDNLSRGLSAFGYSVIAVMVFMLFYYLTAGLVANLALLANGLIIFGVMALIDGTFTLPGLAGVVLTMGMAVDANVLIYERIREELDAGARDLREAVREGYNKVFSTIIDANLTNLIVCFVLYKTATTEVKGFAVTLSIGIVATLFTSLFMTRVIFMIYTDVLGRRTLPMLPIVFPAIARILHPNWNWVGLRKVFWAISLIGIVISIWAVMHRGVQILDTEFRGGVSITMRTKLLEDGRLMLTHTGEGSVEARVHAIGAAITGDSIKDQILAELAGATVLTVGEARVNDAGKVVSDGFQIKIANPPTIEDDTVVTATVVEAITGAFGDDLDVPPALTFTGVGTTEFQKYTHKISRDATTIGDVLGRGLRGNVSDFRGGVIVLVENMSPAVSLEEIENRIDRMRQQPEYARDAAGREVKIFGVRRGDGDGFTSIAVAVYDADINYLKNDPELVDERVAATEWQLIETALSQPQSLDQVSSFSSQIARTMKANAIVAVVLSLLGILAYIWFRFGSLRYSIAAIAALMHDVIITLGALALAGYVAHVAFFSQTLMIEAFQIDLGVIAALLTVIGYSLNDTIVILDRIRENRGKRPLPTMEIVNNSINQTISRTVLTSVTTLIAVSIIYIAGGSGIRPFAFCLLVGIIVGSYSSVAVAAPLVFKNHLSQPKRLDTDE